MRTEFALLLAAPLVSCLTACSVREDRGVCPAWITVCSDGHVADGCGHELTCDIRSFGSGFARSSSCGLGSFENAAGVVYEVPRDERIAVDVFGGVSDMVREDGCLRIRPGNCCDSLFSGHAESFVNGEEGAVMLPLNKNFATVNVRLAGVTEAAMFDMYVYGEIDGLCIPGGAPHHGAFRCALRREGRVFTARIPRQAGGTLGLDIVAASDGSLKWTADLGASVALIGYDWTADDLADIYLDVDLVQIGFSISMRDWEDSGTVFIEM